MVGGFNPSKKSESQLGWLFPIYGIKKMFQTTNQKKSRHSKKHLDTTCNPKGTTIWTLHGCCTLAMYHFVKPDQRSESQKNKPTSKIYSSAGVAGNYISKTCRWSIWKQRGLGMWNAWLWKQDTRYSINWLLIIFHHVSSVFVCIGDHFQTHPHDDMTPTQWCWLITHLGSQETIAKWLETSWRSTPPVFQLFSTTNIYCNGPPGCRVPRARRWWWIYS